LQRFPTKIGATALIVNYGRILSMILITYHIIQIKAESVKKVDEIVELMLHALRAHTNNEDNEFHER
jgi:hypothetical protein